MEGRVVSEARDSFGAYVLWILLSTRTGLYRCGYDLLFSGHV